MLLRKRAARPVPLTLLGPAFVAAVAYVDPGNVATNTSAGATYGHLLLWVVVSATLMATVVQYLSAKLGLVTGRSLPELLGDRLTGPARILYWIQAELVAVATDLAEIVGGAIALHLLFGLPLVVGGLITTAVSLLLLALRDRRGQSAFERLITGLLLMIAIGFLAGLVVAPPSMPDAARGLVPGLTDGGSVVLAAGILGATVMPHAVYLHSALARDRHGGPSSGRRHELLTATRIDIGAAMLLAGAVNVGMLLLAAGALHGSPGTDTIDGAHAAIAQGLGPTVALLFAVGLLCSGLASTAVGSYAGAVIMQGLLRRRIPLLVRRLVTALPALVILALGVEPTQALVVSQVVLSLGIPFALVPLVVLTTRRSVAGVHANRRSTVVLAGVITTAIVGLNLALLWLTVTGRG